MKRTLTAFVILAMAPLASGCVRTAASVVTFPVRAVGYGYDKMTTSQSEADRNRGRRERKQEEREAKERRKAEREARRHTERYEDERSGSGY